MKKHLKNIATLTLILLPGLMASSCTTSAPAVSADGLHKIEQQGFREMYVREGTEWSRYTAIAILDCTVEFRKDWQRDQNEDYAFKVQNKDVERIKTTLAAEFRKVFSKELAASGETIVTEGSQNTLVLRPAIIDLDIIAPDTDTMPDVVTLSDSAGSMTLYLEIYDSTNDVLLARIIDPKDSIEFENFIVRNDVTNLNDARRILRKWANTLSDFLAANRPATDARAD